MTLRLRHIIAVLLVLSCSVGGTRLALAQQSGAAPADGSVLVLGCISDNPRLHHEQLKPLLDYVVPRMADVGIREGRVLMARDPQQMASYLRRGRVDWVTETAGMAMLLHEGAAAEPLLLTERGGRSHYSSVFFVRRDNPIHALDQLRGHSVAFQRPSSTSAWFAPAAALLDHDLRLEILLSPKDRVAAAEVGYLFARSERNIATWVHKGLVDVGVFSDLDWNNPRRMPPGFRDDMRIIHRTEPFPRAVELVRGSLDDRVRARLREVLAGAAEDPAAQDALRRFFRTARFSPIDAESTRALERIAAGVKRVREEVE